MKKFFKNDIVVTAFKLAAISLTVALLLSLTNYFTYPIIEKRQNETANSSLKELISDASEFNDVYAELKEVPEGVTKAYKALDNNEIKGYVIEVASNGYKGNVVMLIGFNKNAELIGIKTLKHEETSGIGTKALESEYLNKFLNAKGASLEVSGVAVDSITGATLTSNAVKENVNKALMTVTLMTGGTVKPNRPANITTEENLKELYPDANVFNNITDLIEDLSLKTVAVYEVKKDEEFLGYVITSLAAGRMGNVYMSASLDQEGAITGLICIKHDETPSYAEKVFIRSYLDQFIGLKGASIEDSGKTIDAISGATYSSNAVRYAVNEILGAYSKTVAYKGGE